MTKDIKNLDQKIKEWKGKYRGAFELPVGDKTCFLREPDMTDYKRAFIAMEEGNSAFGETMLMSLWLEGDHEIKLDNEYFTPAKDEITKLLKYDDAEITPLADRQYEIKIGDAVAIIRVITKEDVSISEKKNPSGKPFVTQAALFEMIRVTTTPEFEDKNNPKIYFPLYQAIEKVQRQKIAQLKKLF